MKKKKIIATILAGSMAFGLTACGKPASNNASSTASAASSTASSSSEGATAASSSSEGTTAASSSSESTTAASNLEEFTLAGLTASYDPAVWAPFTDYGAFTLNNLNTLDLAAPWSITLTRTGTPLTDEITEEYMESMAAYVAETPGYLGEKTKVYSTDIDTLSDGTVIGLMEAQTVMTEEYVNGLIAMGAMTQETVDTYGMAALVGGNISMQTVLYVPVEGELIQVSCTYDMIVNQEEQIENGKAIAETVKLDEASWAAAAGAADDATASSSSEG